MNPVYGMPAGQIALPRMPKGAPSMATARVSWWTAPLVAPYTEPPQPTSPATEPGVDDGAAPPLLLELQDRVLAAEEDAAEIDRREPVEVLDGVVLEQRAQSGVGIPTLLNRMSSRPNLIDRGGDHRNDVGLVGDVALSTATAVPPAASIWRPSP